MTSERKFSQSRVDLKPDEIMVLPRSVECHAVAFQLIRAPLAVQGFEPMAVKFPAQPTLLIQLAIIVSD